LFELAGLTIRPILGPPDSFLLIVCEEILKKYYRGIKLETQY